MRALNAADPGERSHPQRGRSGRAKPHSTRQIRASEAALNAADPDVGATPPATWERTHMDAPFPSPPNLDRSAVLAIVQWLDAEADWLAADHAAARSHGHEVASHSLKNLDLYRNTALHFREAYDLI